MTQLNVTENRRRVLVATAIVVTSLQPCCSWRLRSAPRRNRQSALSPARPRRPPWRSPVPSDTDGANDDSGQKDLTLVCVDFSVANPLHITWNWDRITLRGSKTADACALFDTNNDGLVNYAVQSMDGIASAVHWLSDTVFL